MAGGHVYLYKSKVPVCKSDGGIIVCVLCLMAYTKHEHFSTLCEYIFYEYM